MKQFKILNYKGYEIVRETIKGAIIYKAYKYGELYIKQAFYFYNDKQAYSLFKETLNAK